MATQVKVNGKTLYLTPTGFKAGSKGKVQPSDFYASLPTKSERRKARKEAHRNGFHAHAAAPTALAA